MWPWRRHAPAEEPPPLPNMHYSNADACHNMQVFRNPSRVGCLALQMVINPVGYQFGREYPCSSCGTTVMQSGREDAASPDIIVIQNPAACPYADGP
jgi:hypothetical protein